MTDLGPLDHFFAKRTLKTNYSEEAALFLSTLMHISRAGHLCWKTATTLKLPDSIIQEGNNPLPKTPVVHQEDRYYLQRNWVYETCILNHVQRLRAQTTPFQPLPQDTNLLPTQREAIHTALQHSLSIICGGPGTGKTYTASHLVKHLATTSPKQGKYKVALAAPTGKAAAHLQTIVGSVNAHIESTTLHRLLRIKPGEVQLFNDRKIDADLVIVDEASMIDVPLLAQLLSSISNNTKLVLMGDPDQLPPVEAGSLFAEMAALFGSQLQQSMRTDKTHLLALAAAINRGECIGPTLQWAFDQSLAQKLFEAANPLISWNEPDPVSCLQQLNQFRILGALRQGPFGIDALNQQIVDEMRRRIQPGQWWAIPIMITSNAPQQNLYNGSCGIAIGKSRGDISFREAIAYLYCAHSETLQNSHNLSGRSMPEATPCKNLPPFELSFCLSIHKSQGSEFDKVLALFPRGSESFGREAFYTAVTRAKNQADIVAEDEVLTAMLSQRSRKTSGFTERFI